MWSLVVVLVLCLNVSVDTDWMKKNDLCETWYGTKGVCIHFRNCPTAIERLLANGTVKICNFEGLCPIVCCEVNNSVVSVPLISAKPDTNITERTSYSIPFDENDNNLKRCRDMYSTIPIVIPPFAFIAARKSLPKEFSHMALLGYGESDNIQWRCGGSLISNEFVLTAAHCLHSKLLEKLRFIRLGEFDLNSTTDDADPQDFAVKKIYPHPNYTPSSTKHDIALVRLDRPVRITAYVKPACIGITRNLTNEIPKVMGWGLTESGSNSVNALKSDFLSFVSKGKCRKIYGKSIVDEFQICADGGGLKKEICQADPGGPLQIRNSHYEFDSFPEIVGITSMRNECGVGVYTRVSTYISWIKDIVWPNE